MSDKRHSLHSKLTKYYPNVYFQPPANVKMEYPCIVYNRTRGLVRYAGDDIYHDRVGYLVTVIEYDPDSQIPFEIRKDFSHSTITAFLTKDNLHQTTIILFY